MPDFAEMPPYSCAISAVTFGSTAVTKGGTQTQYDNVGGFGATSAPGGLLVQAPGTVLPMLWQRGSCFNLGQFGRGSNLPALDASDYNPGGVVYARWWDAPQSWGRQNYLIRRPRTLIIVAADDGVGPPPSDVETWVNANYSTTFAPVNVSVALYGRNNFGSLFCAGVPLSSSNSQTAAIPEGDSLTELLWSMPVTNEIQYAGGDCMVAILMGAIMDAPSNNQLVVPVVANSGHSLGSVSGWSLTAATGTVTGGGSFNAGAYVNSLKAANDIAALNAGMAKFNTFQTILYQYDQNPTGLAYLVANVGGFASTLTLSPNPIIPDSTADSLLTGSTIARKTFAVNNESGLLAQLLADAVAFFPALP
jgi:hypothetical protein